MALMFGLFRRGKTKFVGKKNSEIVHSGGSWHQEQIADADEVQFETFEEAMKNGRRLCKSCPWPFFKSAKPV